jgi:5-methylcytosine-specific restriction endonuclease McrA
VGTTLVLNNAFQPLGAISYEEAICVVAQDKAWVLTEHENIPYRSKYMTIYAPKAIVLRHYVPPESFRIKPEKLTNFNLFKRDNYTCQYCGRKVTELGSGETLTRDHVYPRDKGGKDRWDNVTTACSSCNLTKGNRLLKEVGFTLRSEPKIPTTWVIRGKNKLSREQIGLAEEVLGIRSNGEGELYASIQEELPDCTGEEGSS